MEAGVSMRGNRALVTAVLPLPAAPGLPVSPDWDGHVQLGIFLCPGLCFRTQSSVGSSVQKESSKRQRDRKGRGLLVSDTVRDTSGQVRGPCHESWVGCIFYNVEEVGKGKKTIFLLILE